MFKLSIFDRDQQEVHGIQWLLTKYTYPISTIKTASQISSVMEILENESPHILCIELDMIPEDKWSLIKAHIRKYAEQVIAITAEATFERAMQAMSIQAIDLWVKPISPSHIKHTMQQVIHNLTTKRKHQSDAQQTDVIGYEALFVDDEVPYTYPIYLLETENKGDLQLLRKFLKQFDFYYKPEVFLKSDGIVLVFRNPLPDPYVQAQQLLGEWERLTGRALAIVVHAPTEGESLHQIYLKLTKEMEKTFFRGYKQVFQTKNDEPWIDIDPFLTLDEQRQWIRMLEEGKMSPIKTWLYEDFFDLEAPYPEPGLLRTRLTSILAQIRRFMIKKGIVDRDESYQRVFHSILYDPVLYRIVQNIVLFLNNLFQFVKHKQPKHDIIEIAIAYMEEHFTNPRLSLSEVAEYVQRSPSYFSYLLSKKKKQSFSQILLSLRIDQAKELLETTDQTIQSIAQQVGFNNPNYFSRVFKSVTGLTPREYKQGFPSSE